MLRWSCIRSAVAMTVRVQPFDRGGDRLVKGSGGRMAAF